MPRLRKHYDKDYTVIPNNVIRDTRLSFKARGIFLYLWHLKEDYDISLADIQRHSDEDGQSAVRSGVGELETCGYLHFERVRVQGKFVDTEWTINDRPSLDFPKTATTTLEDHNTLKYSENLSTQTKESTKKRPPTSANADPPQLTLVPQVDKDQEKSKTSRRQKTFFPTDPIAQEELRRSILTPSIQTWMAGHGLTMNLDDQWEAFSRKALARGYVYMDWRAAFQNWLTSDYQQPRAGRKATTPLSDERLAEIQAALAQAR